MRLLCVGSRCGIRTKAIPLSAGMWAKNFLNASSPPAEAAMPTTGNSAATDGGSGGDWGGGGTEAEDGGDFFLAAMAAPKHCRTERRCGVRLGVVYAVCCTRPVNHRDRIS